MKTYSTAIRILVCLLISLSLSGMAFWPFGPKKIKDKSPSEPTFDEYNQPDVRRYPVQKPRKKEDEVSVERLEMLAKNGNPNAMLALGKMYFEGLAKLPRDYKKAFNLFMQAADLGNGTATQAVHPLPGQLTQKLLGIIVDVVRQFILPVRSPVRRTPGAAQPTTASSLRVWAWLPWAHCSKSSVAS